MEDDMDNTQTETSQPEAVVFRSGDIRSTQSKNSPKYFVNVKAPRQKLTKKQKAIFLSCGVAVLVMAIVAIVLIVLNHSNEQPESQPISQTIEDQISEYQNQISEFIFNVDGFRPAEDLENDIKGFIDKNKTNSYAVSSGAILLSNLYVAQGDFGAAINTLEEAKKQKTSNYDKYLILSELASVCKQGDDIDCEKNTIAEIVSMPDPELKYESWDAVREILENRLKELEEL